MKHADDYYHSEIHKEFQRRIKELRRLNRLEKSYARALAKDLMNSKDDPSSTPTVALLHMLALGIGGLLLLFILIDGLYLLFIVTSVLVYLFIRGPLKRFARVGGDLIPIGLIVYFIVINFWMGVTLDVLYLAVATVAARIQYRNAMRIVESWSVEGLLKHTFGLDKSNPSDDNNVA